ncbi:MAG: RnfABCDGE type electron transport complex subunit B [Prevotella sp.]|nr:RnfABCDGE type electron transport complex subunit B [Bacteroides sp.]MCM1366130.1 RnfABCDGE type electron transport complex subunit B [Prevotella sp.]MCM1436805.1 RnfABCDGE type electron transport complex subunit B [Prevotella sp.]
MITSSILILGLTGIIAAVVLYIVAKRFAVYEDPKIAQIEELLPGANCGACGFSGCHAFACACAKADSLENLACPGAGQDGMNKIAALLGLKAGTLIPRIAIVACNGTCANRQQTNRYDGVRSCAIEAAYYGGESACIYGCLGCGDCVSACPHDAIHMNMETNIPVVDTSTCVGCGKCVSACPHHIIELAEISSEHPLVWVACRNHDKGAAAIKECNVSCIGCGKCKRACPAEAVSLDNFLAQIDTDKCIGCLKCAEECPRKSILHLDIQ